MTWTGRRLWIAIACVVALCAAGYYLFRPSPPAQVQAPRGSVNSSSGAIGKIVPKDGIVVLSGVPGAVVRSIAVKAGDSVEAGTVLMTLQDEGSKADEELAQLDLDSAQKLAVSQVAAQRLALQLAGQRVQNATRDLETYKALGPQATSAKELARLQAVLDDARVSLQLEQQRMEIVTTQTKSAVDSAQKRLDLAQSRYAADIKAPSKGTILSIDKRVGERLDGQSAVQMADLTVMYVSCQVYQGDLLTLSPGMKATVKSATLSEPMTGTIEEVSRVVDTRSQVGEVRIRLDEPDPASRLVGLEVEVVIER